MEQSPRPRQGHSVRGFSNQLNCTHSLTGSAKGEKNRAKTPGKPRNKHLWRDTCAELEIKRFHRPLADGWVYARCYASEAERRGELPGWLHY